MGNRVDSKYGFWAQVLGCGLDMLREENFLVAQEAKKWKHASLFQFAFIFFHQYYLALFDRSQLNNWLSAPIIISLVSLYNHLGSLLNHFGSHMNHLGSPLNHHGCRYIFQRRILDFHVSNYFLI